MFSQGESREHRGRGQPRAAGGQGAARRSRALRRVILHHTRYSVQHYHD